MVNGLGVGEQVERPEDEQVELGNASASRVKGRGVLPAPGAEAAACAHENALGADVLVGDPASDLIDLQITEGALVGRDDLVGMELVAVTGKADTVGMVETSTG